MRAGGTMQGQRCCLTPPNSQPELAPNAAPELESKAAHCGDDCAVAPQAVAPGMQHATGNNGVGPHLDGVERVQSRNLDDLAGSAANRMHSHGVKKPACRQAGWVRNMTRLGIATHLIQG